MQLRTLATAVFAALTVMMPSTVASAATPNESFEHIATVNPAGADVDSLPEYPAIDALTTPGSGPQEVEFSIEAGAYRGPDGERIEIAKAATFTCILSVDSPHYSSGAGSVIVKPRVACKGPSASIPIRVIGYLAMTSKDSIASLRIVAQSDYTQRVTVNSKTNYGPKQTWYVPRKGSPTKFNGGAYFRGSASATATAPFTPFKIPGAASEFRWVRKP